MPKATPPERQIETRAKNKTTHPGKVVKTVQRRTKAEVQEEKNAKAQAKMALEDARQQSINRTAEFERADIANEDMVDATPRPIFTPKPRPLSRNQRNSPLTPFADTSDIESLVETPFKPDSASKNLADTDDSSEDDDTPVPPSKKSKAKITQKATSARVDVKKPGKTTGLKRGVVDDVEDDIPALDSGETAGRKRKVLDVEGDIPLGSDEEQPQQPKPKKVKAKMRDEINVAAMKMIENEKEPEGNMYAQMVKSMGTSGKPAPKVPSQSRPLKREGAIADIKK
jgi:type II secretory pathway pseudopilin PulG